MEVSNGSGSLLFFTGSGHEDFKVLTQNIEVRARMFPIFIALNFYKTSPCFGQRALQQAEINSVSGPVKNEKYL